MKKAKLYTVHGLVQGVGFRYYTQKFATRLGVWGYVKNLYDGNVEVYAIGNAEQLEELERLLQRGPVGSRVTRLEQLEVSVESSYRSFGVSF